MNSEDKNINEIGFYMLIYYYFKSMRKNLELFRREIKFGI